MLLLKMMSGENKPDFGHGKGFVIVQVASDETIRFYRDANQRATVEISGEDRPLREYLPSGATYVMQGKDIIDIFHCGPAGRA